MEIELFIPTEMKNLDVDSLLTRIAGYKRGLTIIKFLC